MEKNLYKYILKHSASQQVKLLILIVAGYPVIYIGFNLPKLIINDAIQGGPGSRDFLGWEFGQFQYLIALCVVFLLVVLINGGVKYFVNVYRGAVGERLLRRLRYDLIKRMLRFPLPTFSKIPQGEVISMVTLEVEKLGKFMGESISLPAFQGGILLTSLTFLMIENWIMGVAAMALYPLQIYLIPKLQISVNHLEAGRIRLVRSMSARIGETMSGVQEIHTHDTTQYELADFSDRLGKVFEVRFTIFKKKFFIKFFNNFLAQLGPFSFYLVGGYLVINNQLTVGGLVAMLSAHKEMYAPWKEILTYYQQKEESRVKYEQVISQFEPAGMLDEERISSDQVLDAPLHKEIVASGLTYVDDNDNAVLESISMQMDLSKHTAIVGPTGSGKSSLTMILARLLDHTRGQLTIDNHDVRQLAESVTGRKIAYAGQGSHIFAGTLGDNLYYSLKHRPVLDPEYEGEAQKKAEWNHRESLLSGNSNYDINADWIDYQATGAEEPGQLINKLVRVLKIVELDEEVFHYGLRSTIDPEVDPEATQKIFETRISLREKMQDPQIQKYVEAFDPEKYNANATLAENLMFGTPVGKIFDIESLAEHPYVKTVLQKVGLEDTLVEIGHRLAALMIELFSDLDADNQNYQQFSFLDVEDLPSFQALCSCVEREGIGALNEEERAALMEPTFKIIPTRHRLGLIDDAVQAKVLEARKVFRDDLPEELSGAIDFFDPDKYNAATSVQDNILFGKLAYGEANAAKTISDLLRDMIEEKGMYEAVINAGLSTRVGTGGIILSAALQQKVALARCIIKRPDVLVLYQAFSALEGNERVSVMKKMREEFKNRGVIFALKFPSMAQEFDHIFVMRGGEVVEQGTYESLSKPGSYFSELLDTEKSQT
ncbi:MAG: ABC transporter ATP-binding protein/permease [SAR324 cluster bacterium]|nr:ABC transporter ATP-binding protein/permease [SAR324 cluster bacterium]